jgi:hypothetical protein
MIATFFSVGQEGVEMCDFVEVVKVLNAPAGLLGRKGRKDDECTP